MLIWKPSTCLPKFLNQNTVLTYLSSVYTWNWVSHEEAWSSFLLRLTNVKKKNEVRRDSLFVSHDLLLSDLVWELSSWSAYSTLKRPVRLCKVIYFWNALASFHAWRGPSFLWPQWVWFNSFWIALCLNLYGIL